MTVPWVAAFCLQWFLLLVMAVLLIGVLRRLGSFSPNSLRNLEVGDMLPRLEAVRADGSMWTSDMLLGSEVVLLVVSTTCQACDILLDQLVELTRRPVGGLANAHVRVVSLFISGQTFESSTERLDELAQYVELIADVHGYATRVIGVRSVPVGIRLDPKGRIRQVSINPHGGWLYHSIGLAPPEEPVHVGHIPWISYTA